MKAKSSSLDEKPVNLIVSSANVVCAYAYIRSIADLCVLFALASCVAKGSSGQDSDDLSVFELRYLVFNTILIKFFFF